MKSRLISFNFYLINVLLDEQINYIVIILLLFRAINLILSVDHDLII